MITVIGGIDVPYNPYCWCVKVGHLHIHIHPFHWLSRAHWNGGEIFPGEWMRARGPLTLYHTGRKSYDIGCGKG